MNVISSKPIREIVWKTLQKEYWKSLMKKTSM